MDHFPYDIYNIDYWEAALSLILVKVILEDPLFEEILFHYARAVEL